MLKNKSTAPSTEWTPNHFAWSLVDGDELSVKLEEIPEGGESELHFHEKSRQFFFILEGKADVKVEERCYQLKKHDGIEVLPGKKHQISNRGTQKLLFLLISSPKVQENDILRIKTV
jgi:mannose-6-phosphate isomerase-like protein (cupin superfamily)